MSIDRVTKAEQDARLPWGHGWAQLTPEIRRGLVATEILRAIADIDIDADHGTAENENYARACALETASALAREVLKRGY